MLAILRFMTMHDSMQRIQCWMKNKWLQSEEKEFESGQGGHNERPRGSAGDGSQLQKGAQSQSRAEAVRRETIGTGVPRPRSGHPRVSTGSGPMLRRAASSSAILRMLGIERGQLRREVWRLLLGLPIEAHAKPRIRKPRRHQRPAIQ